MNEAQWMLSLAVTTLGVAVAILGLLIHILIQAGRWVEKVNALEKRVDRLEEWKEEIA